MPGKSKFFCEIAWKICLKKSEFFDPFPRPPDFKPDWRRWWECCLHYNPTVNRSTLLLLMVIFAT